MTCEDSACAGCNVEPGQDGKNIFRKLLVLCGPVTDKIASVKCGQRKEEHSLKHSSDRQVRYLLVLLFEIFQEIFNIK